MATLTERLPTIRLRSIRALMILGVGQKHVMNNSTVFVRYRCRVCVVPHGAK
jgi:hypothetical protein